MGEKGEEVGGDYVGHLGGCGGFGGGGGEVG